MTSASSDDSVFCADLLPRVSRTFALSIEALPQQLREPVRISYLLCRIVDTIEDEAAMDIGTRRRLFDTFQASVANDALDPGTFEAEAAQCALGGSGDYGELCRGSGAVFRMYRGLASDQREAIRPHVSQMSTGMRLYAERADVEGTPRIYDVPDLERYCYYVAGTAGELLTKLFRQFAPDLSPEARLRVDATAVSFGLGLQMVNIIKDVSADIRRGVCYLPADLAAKQGVPLDDILDPAHREGALEVVRTLTARARQHLDRARGYTLAWPIEDGREIRLFCAVPLTLALATLPLIESGHDTLKPGATPKVTHQVVRDILMQSRQAVESDADLRAMFAHYAGDARFDSVDDGPGHPGSGIASDG